MSFIVLVSKFYIFSIFIISSYLGKLIRRAVTTHKRIFCVPVQVGYLFYNITCETMVDEFILFISNQSLLECKQTPVSLETEYINYLVQIKANPPAHGTICKLEPGFMIIKYLLVVFPVLQRIHMIILRCNAHFVQFGRVYMKCNIKSCGGIHHKNGKHLCGSA